MIGRRILSAFLAGLALIGVGQAALAQTLPPNFPFHQSVQQRRANQPIPYVAVGNNAPLNGAQQASASFLNASGNPISQQLTFVSPANQAITSLKLAMPGFAVESLNESLNTQTIVWKAAIEYPTTSTLKHVTWNGGNSTITVVPAHTNYVSDPIPVYIPAGTTYTVRMYGVIQGMSPPVFGITVSGGSITAVGGISISSMTWANGLVTVTSSLAHGLPIGITFPFTTAGVTPTGYNGSGVATVTGTSTFTFPLATNPGSVTTQGNWISYGQGLNTAPTISLSGLGAGTGGSVTPTFNFSVGKRVIFTNNGTGYTGSPVTLTSSGGGGSVQPTWLPQVETGAIVDAALVTPGSPDFTSAPTLAFSGGSGSSVGATATLAGGIMVGTPAFVAGSGYTNGTYVASFPTGGVNMLPGVGNFESGSAYRSYVYTGSSAADYTSNAAGSASGVFSFYAFNPIVLAQLSSPAQVLGNVGTSINYGYQDVQDYNGLFGYVAKSWAGDAANGGTGGPTSGVPFINISKPSSTMTALLGSGQGQIATLGLAGVTAVTTDHPRNDLNNGMSAANALALMQKFWAILQAQGITVYAQTIIPYTTSSDGWLTTGNQTAVTPFCTQALAYNALLRANAASYGVQLIDLAAFLDTGGASNPTCLFRVSGYTGEGAGALATVTSGAVSSVALALHSGGVPTNGGYLSGGSGTVPLVFFGGGGTGAAGTATVTSGVVTGFTVTSGGSGYSATNPPLVSPIGALTSDGIHLSAYGYMLVTATSGLFLPARFPL